MRRARARLARYSCRRYERIRLDTSARSGGSCIARVGRARRFDEQKMRFVFGDRAMFDTLRDDEEFPWTERYVAFAHADGDMPLQHEEKVIRVVVRVPDELAFDLHDHEIVTVELANHTRLPVTLEGCELLCKIDGRHGLLGEMTHYSCLISTKSVTGVHLLLMICASRTLVCPRRLVFVTRNSGLPNMSRGNVVSSIAAMNESVVRLSPAFA